EEERSDVAWQSFNRRAERLEKSFKQVEETGIVTFRPFLPTALDLTTLARQRNDLLHGSPWTLFQYDPPTSRIDPGEAGSAKIVHVSHNIATGVHGSIDVVTLDGLSKKAADYAVRITFMTADLATAKKAAGQQPLIFRA
ncbi:MAG: hypothetical protein ABFD86_18130, partial [Bryobacteraceae bacterium]